MMLVQQILILIDRNNCSCFYAFIVCYKLSGHYSNLGNNLQDLFENPGKSQKSLNFERIKKVKHADYQPFHRLLSKKCFNGS